MYLMLIYPGTKKAPILPWRPILLNILAVKEYGAKQHADRKSDGDTERQLAAGFEIKP